MPVHKPKLIKMKTRIDQQPLLTRNEAAGRLRLCLRSLEKLLASKAISCVRMGKAIRIAPEELERFIKTSTINA